MSKIQEALVRLQKKGGAKAVPDSASSESAPRQLDQEEASGPDLLTASDVYKLDRIYHVDPNELRTEGLLMPFERFEAGTDEFRKIKRPILDYIVRGKEEGIGTRNTLLVTSAMPRAGKTFCAVSLAASMSRERETNVLLVDGDIAKSHITKVLGLGDSPGLMGLLKDEGQGIVDSVVRTDFNGILILPSGQTDEQSTEFLASERMSEVLNQLSSTFRDRVIIIDSPPMLITSEAQALADKVAQILVVVEAGVTTHFQLEETIALLNPEKAISVVLNKKKLFRKGASDGGGYGYYGY